MSHCAIKQNSFAACEEIWASAAAAGRYKENRETVVCPKPRRLGPSHTTVDPTYARPLRWHDSRQQEDCDSKAGNELMDIILAKGGLAPEQSVPQAASPGPFFSGSPPGRVSNPLIQDARFGDEKPVSTRKGGCVRLNFGNSPAVRIEGFDCLDRDSRNCSIPALA